MRLPLIYLIALLMLPVSANSKSWQQSITKAPAGPYKEKKHCKLYYDLSWKGSLKAGKCEVEFKQNKGKSQPVQVISKGYSSGLVRSLFPYDFYYESKYNGSTLKPYNFNIWEKTKEETRNIYGTFKGNKVYTRDEITPLSGGKSQVRKSSFGYPQFFDLYSCVLYVGSQPLKKGEEVNMVIYPFDKPYLAKVKVLGREKHKGHQCIKLDLKMSKINQDLSLKHYDKMKSATMWITDNDDRVMVELRSKIFIGDVRATLKKTEWY